MSEKPSILEGGSSRNFSPVDSLSINKQSDGLSTWVLADSVEVGSLDASQNGLYLAIEDDYFAYDQIVVNVSDDLADADDATKATGKIVGKDPDIDPNNDYAVGLDENGNLTKEMIPSAIHIVVPPKKLHYENGDTLDFSGIHVYLMDNDNNRYTCEEYPTGLIPFDELSFNPLVAQGGDPTDVSKYVEVFGKKIYYGSPSSPETVWSTHVNSGNWAYCNWYYSESSSGIRYFHYYTPKNENAVICLRLVDDYIDISAYYPDIDTGESIGFYMLNGSYKEEREEYMTGSLYDDSVGYISENNYQRGFTFSGRYKMVFVSGDNKKEIKLENDQTVTVSWVRSDGETLDDTFTIKVGGEEGDDPSQPDPWGGYADVSWGGHHYNLNRRIVPEVHYANGYLWQEGISTEYNVEQAASMGWLILIR